MIDWPTTSEKQSLSAQLKQADEEFYALRKRHANGAVSVDVYEEFAAELRSKRQAIIEKIEDFENHLSNPKELISFALSMAGNLYQMWDSGDFYQKQMVQTTLFPSGLLYDSKIDHYRTPEINTVFAYIAHLAQGLDQKKAVFLVISPKKTAQYPQRERIRIIFTGN